MEPPITEVADIQLQLYYSYIDPLKDERLSWPDWLTYSGRFTHINGHPSATGRVQDRESSPAEDRRSTAVAGFLRTWTKRYMPSSRATLPL